MRTTTSRVLWIAVLMTICALAIAQQPGEKLPDFALQDARGEVVTPETLRGAPVLLNFWATWCGPCREELPLFQQVHEEVPELQVFLINLSEGRDRATAFLDDLDVNLRTAVDPHGDAAADAEATADVARRLRVRGMPTTYFIDGDGVVRAVRVGQILPNALTEALAEIGVQWRP